MIDTSAWKEFRVGDYFEVTYGTFKAKSESVDEGGVPHITTTQYNNGIGYYVKEQMFPAHCITVASDGCQGASFYHTYPISASNIVSVCVPHDDVPMNEIIGNFLCSLFRKEGEKYSWGGFKYSVDRVRETRLHLPATSDGQPDWDYMESYMKAVMEEAEKSLENLKRADDTKHLIDVSGWGEFRVGDLLHMEKQIELNPVYAYNNSTENETLYPFYGQSSDNNGIIDYYYLGENLLNNKDAQFCIMIHSNTHLAYCVNTPFYLKDGHGATTIFTNKNLNDMTTYFLISVLNVTMNGNFDYDMKATKERLNDLIVKLPITSTGEPDWQYMEDYMRGIMDKSEQIIFDLQIGA